MDPKAWPTSGQNVCRCCLAEGCYKDISTEYFWMGKREVYSDMLNETFDVNISFSKSGSTNSRLICEPCISRLRDASEFKKQVVDCERMFMNHLSEPGSSTMAEPLSTITPDDVKVIKVEAVKQEKDSDGDEDFADTTDFLDDDDDDEDDLDNQPLTKFATKVPKKEAVDIMDLLDNTELTIKRKAPTKTKAVPAKKAKTTTKVTAKATVSKAKTAARPKTAAATKAVVEKKKKEIVKKHSEPPRRNAEIILKYTTAYPFKVHIRSIKCVYCDGTYDEPIEFRSHMDEEHTQFSLTLSFGKIPKSEFVKADITNMRCKICHDTLENLESAAKHLKSHSKAITLDCPFGVMPYKLERDTWKCAVCTKDNPSLLHLNKHTTTHFLTYVCDICGKSYVATSGLLSHLRTKHEQEYKVQCRSCKKYFPSMEAKAQHKKTEKKCMPHCCTECPERFLSWELKQKHMLEAHNQSKMKYQCSHCNSNFGDRRAFYIHFKMAHSQDSPICMHCGLKFPNMSRMNRHLRKHVM